MKNRVTATVDLDAIRANYKHIKQIAGESRVMAVVKADAYGHGSARIAEELQKLGCNDFAVACLSEAEHLRENGITGNILILGPTDDSLAGSIVSGNFIQAVDSAESAERLARAGRIRVHIKVDTGMSRIGIYCHGLSDIGFAAAEIARIIKNPGISVEGIFTHFADSDGANRDFTEKQFSVFKALTDTLAANGMDCGTRHCCNSAAIIRFPEMRLDMVRAGIILYGLMPSAEINDPHFRPAMKLSARICAVHRLEKGDHVSYGCTYTADRATRVAVISIGYADGFSRLYSGKKVVRINGREFATVGRICMDMCMVDIGNELECAPGDEAVIFETADDIERLAEAMGTINYEILCSLKHRVLLQYND